jgi:hypothetical protein
LVDEDSLDFNPELDNEEFYLNVWERYAGTGATVRWDEGHGQFYDTANASKFVGYAEREGFTVEAGNSIPSDTNAVDALVVTSPSKAFSDAEKTALSNFVGDGGAVFFHDQSDFNDFDATANANEIATALGLNFRFNDDQVQDETNNLGAPFRPTTGRFNGDEFDLFYDRDDLEGDLELIPEGDAIDELGIGEGCSSLLDSSEQPLDDDTIVAVRSESEATISDADSNGDAVSYPSGTDIPLVAVDGSVAGLPAPMVNDDELEFNGSFDNEEFYLNLWDSLLSDSGTVRWDESHGQFWGTGKFGDFIGYAEENGYTVEAGNSIPSDTSSVDGLVVTTPSNAFSNAEFGSLSSFVADGGVVFLHDQSDFNDFDATANLNAIAAELDVAFRFNDAQVIDDTNNTGSNFRPTTTNFNTANFGPLFETRPGVDDGGREFFGETYPYLSYNAALATEFAQNELSGQTVDIEFDPDSSAFNGGVRDPFGRLLAYVNYDAGSGSRDTLYNEALVEGGYARVYGSGFSKHERFLSAELDARGSNAGVWEKSNPSVTPTVRNRPVEEVFVPDAEAVTTTNGSLARTRAPVTAEDSASPTGVALIGIDTDANVAMIGGLPIDEGFEQAEGFGVDTSVYENFVLFTNLVDTLTNTDGSVLVEGGHGQFNADGGLSAEDVAYYQRFLEGVGIGLEGINDVTADRLSTARALVVTTGLTEFSDAEKTAVADFAAGGGAVVLMGAASADAAARSYLNDLAAAIGTDLRLSGTAVTDGSSNLNGDQTVPRTTSFSGGFGLFRAYDPEAIFGSTPGALGPATDPDGDGDFEDVNGDGVTTYNDVVYMNNNVDDPAVADRPDAFDFDDDGDVDDDDVTALFEEV